MRSARISLAMVIVGLVACSGGSGSTSPTNTGNTGNTGATTGGKTGGSTGGATAPTAIAITEYMFNPTPITVPVGTTVQWTDVGNVSHTTTSDTGLWDSGALSTGGSANPYGGSGSAGTYSFTFLTPGTYHYHCSLHPPALYPNFVGTIIVQ